MPRAVGTMFAPFRLGDPAASLSLGRLTRVSGQCGVAGAGGKVA